MLVSRLELVDGLTVVLVVGLHLVGKHESLTLGGVLVGDHLSARAVTEVLTSGEGIEVLLQPEVSEDASVLSHGR